MFWFISGLITGAVVWWLINAKRSGKINISWYQWVLGALAYLTAIFAIQNYRAFQAALEPTAAGFVLKVYGLAAIVLATLIWLIPVIAKAIGGKDKKTSTAAS